MILEAKGRENLAGVAHFGTQAVTILVHKPNLQIHVCKHGKGGKAKRLETNSRALFRTGGEALGQPYAHTWRKTACPASRLASLCILPAARPVCQRRGPAVRRAWPKGVFGELKRFVS